MKLTKLVILSSISLITLINPASNDNSTITQPFSKNQGSFKLISLEDNFPIFQNFPNSARGAMRYVANEKAQMLIHHRQKSKSFTSLNLKVTVHFWKCSTDNVLLPKETFIVSKDNDTLQLLDFDCLLPDLGDWCATGKPLKARYFDRLGHDIEMFFICDKDTIKGGSSDLMGSILALGSAIFMLVLAILAIRKITNDNKKYIPVPQNDNFSVPQQDNRFLTVPARIRKRSTSNQLEIDNSDKERSYQYPTTSKEKNSRSSRKSFKDQFNIPRIIVNGPEE